MCSLLEKDFDEICDPRASSRRWRVVVRIQMCPRATAPPHASFGVEEPRTLIPLSGTTPFTRASYANTILILLFIRL